MSDEEGTPRIVVRDRRAFTREGARRTPDPASEPAPSPPSTAEEATPTEQPEETSASTDPPTSDEVSAPAASSRDSPPDDPRFRQLANLLFMQAAAALGPRPDETAAPSDARRAEILEVLQATIGMLEMLEQKTRGRLSPTDARFLSQVLYQLRMAYVDFSRSPAAQTAASP